MKGVFPGQLISDNTLRLARSWPNTGIIMAVTITLLLLAPGPGADHTVHARGMRVTRRDLDSVEIDVIDPTTIPPGSYHGPRHGAGKIIDSVLAEQSLQVGVVSGATGSSKAVLKAIENTLSGGR